MSDSGPRHRLGRSVLAYFAIFDVTAGGSETFSHSSRDYRDCRDERLRRADAASLWFHRVIGWDVPRHFSGDQTVGAPIRLQERWTVQPRLSRQLSQGSPAAQNQDRTTQGTFPSIRSVSHSGETPSPSNICSTPGSQTLHHCTSGTLATPSTSWADGGAVTSSL